MIQAQDLSFSYGTTKVFSSISFSIEKGDFVGILGPNGAGKSTLVKLILGELEADGGSVNASTNRIGYVPQELDIYDPFPGTVREIFQLVTKKHSIPKELGVSRFLDKKFTDLSGGQKQRVLIAFALLSDPELLILDEPTVGVDLKAQNEFYSMLKRLNKKEGITILLITHDVGMVPNSCKTTLCINHGICCVGHSKDTTKLLKKVYGSQFREHHHHH